MGIRSFLARPLSRQLGNPSGLLGGVVARGLNKTNAAAMHSAVTVLAPGSQEVVADIGFGGGLGLSLLLDVAGEVHGVEPSRSMVDRARGEFGAPMESGRLRLHHAPMESIPLPDAALDGWISLNTVYFVADLAPAFAELARVTRPGGRGVLGVADPQWLAAQPFAATGFIVRALDDVVTAVERAGFSVRNETLATGDHPYHLLVADRTD